MPCRGSGRTLAPRRSVSDWTSLYTTPGLFVNTRRGGTRAEHAVVKDGELRKRMYGLMLMEQQRVGRLKRWSDRSLAVHTHVPHAGQ